MTDKGSYPSTYTLSSGEAAKAELRELREVAEEMAAALKALGEAQEQVIPLEAVSAMPREKFDAFGQILTRAELALARYEALRDG